MNRALQNLQHLRANFSVFLTESEELACTWNIRTELNQKQQQTVKRFFDELASDYRIDNALKSFEIKIFYASLDIIISQIGTRFTSLQTVVEYFSFLKPQNITSLPQNEIAAKARALVNKYPDDLTEDLIDEIASFRSILSDEINMKTTVREVAKLLFEENSMILSSFPNLGTAIQLYLTLPVTTATAERSFSKLKLIKNYLRNSMGQSRLSDLATLSIEQDKTKKVDIDGIVREFILLRKRRL